MEPSGVSASGEPELTPAEVRWLVKRFKKQGGNPRYPVRHQGQREMARRRGEG